jgi:hypothetical protein
LSEDLANSLGIERNVGEFINRVVPDGAAARGGDWTLEAATGAIESRIAFSDAALGAYDGLLANALPDVQIVGMPARTLRHISFAVGSGIVGVSSLLIGFNVGIIDYNMGFDIILMATVAMTIGGLGNVGAAAGGGFVLGVIQNLALWKMDSKWQMALSFAILILVYGALALGAGSAVALIGLCLVWGGVNHLGLNLIVGRLAGLDPGRRGAILGVHGSAFAPGHAKRPK